MRSLVAEVKNRGLTADWLAAKPASPQFSGSWSIRFFPDNIKALFKEVEAASTQ
jgi:hypothetical protein